MSYFVKLPPTARKQLHSLPKKFLPKIIARIDDLSTDPRPPRVKKLSGKLDTYRTQQGPYRIVYQVRDEDGVVLILSVADRKDAYR